jgi:hypothetical protein
MFKTKDREGAYLGGSATQTGRTRHDIKFRTSVQSKLIDADRWMGKSLVFSL